MSDATGVTREEIAVSVVVPMHDAAATIRRARDPLLALPRIEVRGDADHHAFIAGRAT